ncbi:uncharacterized protein LOC144882688 [Branchiostoma floridae x Branchiostoma japonicum]
MVVPIVTPEALQERYWSTPGDELCLQDKKLVFPILVYPKRVREQFRNILQARCAGILDMADILDITEESLSVRKISFTCAEILRKASSSVVLNTYKITPEGCTLEEDGVTISFPRGCVRTERTLLLEIEKMPVDDTLTKGFSAVTPVLTVYQEKEEDFIKPVTVTMPWAWKSSCRSGRTVLMERRSRSHQWSLFGTEFWETEDMLTFTRSHFSGVVGAKQNDSDGDGSSSCDLETEDEVDSQETEDKNASKPSDVQSTSEAPTKVFQTCWNGYIEDIVYLIIDPIRATMDSCIHLMCVHKDEVDNVKDFFQADNMQRLPLYRQRILMGSDERIDANFDEEGEVVGHPRDVKDGIYFFFPPVTCNRSSVRLILNPRAPYQHKNIFSGSVHFTRLSESGVRVDDPRHRINDPRHRINAIPVFLSCTDAEIVAATNTTQHEASANGEEVECEEDRINQAACSAGRILEKSKQAVISVLSVNDEYNTSNGDVSTINLQVVRLLRRNGASVHCTALQASDQERKGAVEDGINLLLPVQYPGDTRTPSLEWLVFDHRSRYPDIPQDIKYIIGHAVITSRAAKNIRMDRCKEANLVMFNHDMPEETEQYKGTKELMGTTETTDRILEDAKYAYAVFSVGGKIYGHFETKYKKLEDSKPRNHFVFLPRPSAIFEAINAQPGGDLGEKVVFVGRLANAVKMKGHHLVARTMSIVTKEFPNVRCRIRGVGKDDWEKILSENCTGRIKTTLKPHGTEEDIADDMKEAHLVIMPSLSEPFGLIGLEAIAAGIPVLISDQSGLADMMQELIKDKKLGLQDLRTRIVKTSVNENDLDKTAELWAEKIVDTLKYSESEFANAADYKRKLLASKYWESSHQDLLRVCGLTE